MSPLIDAVETADYEASVFVRTGPGGTCSGSLVHPRIVITAWHCAQSDGMSVDVRSAGTTSSYAVVGRYVPDGTFTETIEAYAVDVAALVLDSPVEGVTPYVLAYDGMADRVDEPIRAVAYGNGSSLLGRRQTSIGTVKCDARREGSDYLFPMFTSIRGAPGDSGGSILDSRGELLGVMSATSSGGCLYGGGTWFAGPTDTVAARIEPNAAVVTAAFDAVGAVPPRAPADSGPASPDAGLRDVDASSPPDALEDAGSPDAGSLDADAGRGSVADSDERPDSPAEPSTGCSVGSGAAPHAPLSWVLLLAVLISSAVCASRRARTP